MGHFIGLQKAGGGGRRQKEIRQGVVGLWQSSTQLGWAWTSRACPALQTCCSFSLEGVHCCQARAFHCGVQVPSEKVALAQKMLITKANIAGKFAVSGGSKLNTCFHADPAFAYHAPCPGRGLHDEGHCYLWGVSTPACAAHSQTIRCHNHLGG